MAAAGTDATENTPLLREDVSSNGTIDPEEVSNGTSLPEDDGSQKGSSSHLKYIVPAISIGVFLAAADQTIIVASYGKIGSDLKALNLTSWIATSYFLTLTSFQPLYGKLCNIFGRKACLLFAYIVFGTGSLFCGLAQDINQLIAARVYQGIGGGGMTTVVSILISDLVPLRDRGLWQGIINIIYATGSGIGGPLGGILADYIGWRWAFIAQAPMCLLAFLLVTFLLHVPGPDSGDWIAKLKRIDFLGATVLVGAVLGFSIGLDRGSNVSWSIPESYVSLIVSIVLFIAFILVEIYVAPEPFAPGHLIFDQNLLACYACNFFSFAGFMGILFYIPLYFQAVNGVSASVAGVRLLPQIIFGVSGSLAAGIFMRRYGTYYGITIFGYGLLLSGSFVLFLFSGAIADAYQLMIVGAMISAFGNGIGVTTTLIGLISNASSEDQAVVTACSYLFRSLGSVLGISLASTVEQQLLRDRLKLSLHGSQDIDRIVDGVRQSLDFIKTLPIDLQAAVRRAYGWSTDITFAVQTGVTLFALYLIKNSSSSAIVSVMLDEYSRYRPALFAAAGVALLGGIFYFHSHANPTTTASSPQLHRRGAILRRHRRDNSDRTQNEAADTPSALAIAHLEQLERENGAYGTFRIETEDGRMVESGLLPSLLVTRDQLMAEVGMPESHAERMREMMEDTFLESFFALDFPPNHTIPEGSAEREYLTRELSHRGISNEGIQRALSAFNGDPAFGEALRVRRQLGTRVTLSANAPAAELEEVNEVNPVVADAGETESVFSWRNDNADGEPAREGQNLLNLLYHIAEDQAKKDGYIHRGVTCNNCGMLPIQGIRYRCDNCVDFDLCENCEAQQVHNKTHIFLKVRIPAPYMGIPRQGRPLWYPGKPETLPKNLPTALARRLAKETSFENTELDALWDQYRCLANTPWPADPNKLGMAIDRKTFDRCFIPNTSSRPPPPSLIFDRMFAFYDTNGDNLIGFEEFAKAIASFNNKDAIDEKMRRIFKGYDVDGDGYIERKDFLRMFRAYYALIKELSADLVQAYEEDFGPGDGTAARDIVTGTRPISSAFSGNFGNAETPRTGEGKRTNLEGDMEVVDGVGVLRPDGLDHGDMYTVVGDAAFRRQFIRRQQDLTGIHPDVSPPSSVSGGVEVEGESHNEVTGEQARPGEAREEDDEESTDDEQDETTGSTSAAEARRRAIHERWRRRQFYTDEEDGATAPEGFEQDADENESENESIYPGQSSRPPSLRSRSSSKVRFEDDEYDVRSNGSTSVGERWGGFEVPEPERDIGKEILYQATKEGMNELLDVLFKEKEDLLMDLRRTRNDRIRWAAEIEWFKDPSKRFERNDPEFNLPGGLDYENAELDELLGAAGYSVIEDTEPTPSAHVPPTAEEAIEEDEEYEEIGETSEVEAVDPTLPQHRPNEAPAIPSSAAAASSLHLRLDNSTLFPVPQPDNSNQAEATAPKFSPVLKPTPSTGSPVHQSPKLPPHKRTAPRRPPSKPSPRQLTYWAALNDAEREILVRGGGAKLNYDEFRRIMNTEEGKKLNFLSTYIEMASF
ncbi:EF hand domain protein [Talaromyces stipitatus ATCC 10500]|uniref:EF hand domain protein n=1 Tax=Talaromyces stipitatus (strain ATCC 10500 / CBS 375.48 / QM 6759 / NRRL 1006) TaxID=441959 RepID=B8MGS0_TALSN|nr:EF hand domain protein [Talaromyces stipitatus ATCC 10500]EED16301.1 EF hand domain protein [Talaromyces stipitatus ATCC 10500]